MADSNAEPRLHFSWLLDVVGSPPPKVPVLLSAKGLKAHTAIIAQSGSGKSFALGRLLEEIASRTRARIVILDPNSDFVRFGEIDDGAWEKKHLEKWFGPDDTLEGFKERWEAVGVRTLTLPTPDDLPESRRGTNVSAISIRWGDLSLPEMAGYLGLSWSENHAEMRVIANACIVALYNHEKSGEKGIPYTLAYFRRCLSRMWGDALDLKRRSKPDPGRPELPRELELAGSLPEAYSRVDGRCYDLATFDMWDRVSETSVRELLDEMTSPGSDCRVVTLDLPSLSSKEVRLCATQALLDSIVTSARERWGETIKAEGAEDRRSPIFIVVDEAHNLAPSEPNSDRAKTVTDSLISIAAEGRKYGLFLILVTQRPSRLHPSILSQCDNLCLLRMSNRHDLQLVEKSFGFVPEGMVDRALEFDVGDCLLSGNFVERSLLAHVAPRRTVEGGSNLKDDHWTKDPLSDSTATSS